MLLSELVLGYPHADGKQVRAAIAERTAAWQEGATEEQREYGMTIAGKDAKVYGLDLSSSKPRLPRGAP